MTFVLSNYGEGFVSPQLHLFVRHWKTAPFHELLTSFSDQFHKAMLEQVILLL
jgi:hypothetical protein